MIAVSWTGLFSSCSTPSGNVITVVETGGYQQNHGPFDNNGNYVESWADKPPKRQYVTREQYAQLNKKSRKNKRTPRVEPIPTVQPIQRYVSHTPAVAAAPAKPKTSSRPKKAATPKTSSRPKPKSVAVKPKAKPPIVHRVKKGDTLYGLSRKYKTTIGSIQRANKLNTSHIAIGQRLIIPRR